MRERQREREKDNEIERGGEREREREKPPLNINFVIIGSIHPLGLPMYISKQFLPECYIIGCTTLFQNQTMRVLRLKTCKIL